MAYVSQEKKKELAPAIKAVLKKYGVKGTIGVNHHSTLVVNIKSGDLDFLTEHNAREQERINRLPFNPYVGTEYTPDTYFQVNECWIVEWTKDETLKAFYSELINAMKGEDYFNHDDSMTDYFHRSHYIDINIGKWDKPYICNTVLETV